MRIQEIVLEQQQLNEGVIGATVDRMLDKLFGPSNEPISPEEFNRKISKIPQNATNVEMKAQVEHYLRQAGLDQKIEQLAWKKKTTFEKMKHYVIVLVGTAAVIIGPEKLGQALGDLLVKLAELIINALFKRGD